MSVALANLVCNPDGSFTPTTDPNAKCTTFAMISIDTTEIDALWDAAGRPVVSKDGKTTVPSEGLFRRDTAWRRAFLANVVAHLNDAIAKESGGADLGTQISVLQAKKRQLDAVVITDSVP